jgi:hypothetical protein
LTTYGLPAVLVALGNACRSQAIHERLATEEANYPIRDSDVIVDWRQETVYAVRHDRGYSTGIRRDDR